MSHIRGVKVESRIIVPILPEQRSQRGHQYRRLRPNATSHAGRRRSFGATRGIAIDFRTAGQKDIFPPGHLE
jgi:hypothetical protein